MKKTLLLALLGVFVFPIAANAAWWNPFDWFRPKVTHIVQSEPVVNEPISPLRPELIEVFGDPAKIKEEKESLKKEIEKISAPKDMSDEIMIDVTPVPTPVITPNPDGLTQGQRNDVRIRQLTIQAADIDKQALFVYNTAYKDCSGKYKYDMGAQRACMEEYKDRENALRKQSDDLKQEIFDLETGKINLP